MVKDGASREKRGKREAKTAYLGPLKQRQASDGQAGAV